MKLKIGNSAGNFRKLGIYNIMKIIEIMTIHLGNFLKLTKLFPIPPVGGWKLETLFQ